MRIKHCKTKDDKTSKLKSDLFEIKLKIYA